MRIAVTGSSGFVGSNLVSYLVANGHDVRPFRSNSLPISNSGIISPKSAYYDSSLLEKSFDCCDAVVHLAGVAHRTTKYNSGYLKGLYRSNVETSLRVAQAALNSKVSKFVFVSSISVYGTISENQDLTSDSVPSPSCLYGYSKLLAEVQLRNFLADKAMHLYVIRPPLIYGVNCPGNMKKLLRLVSFLPIVPFGSLANLKSFISIRNMCGALESAITCPSLPSGDYLVSDDFPVSTSSISRWFLEGLGRSTSQLITVPLPDVFPLSLIVHSSSMRKLSAPLLIDNSHFKNLSGWVPMGSPEVVFRDMAKYFKSASL